MSVWLKGLEVGAQVGGKGECWGRGEERCGGPVTLVLRFGCTLWPRNGTMWEGGVSTKKKGGSVRLRNKKKDGSRNTQ